MSPAGIDSSIEHPHRPIENTPEEQLKNNKGCGSYYQQTCLGDVSQFRQDAAKALGVLGAITDLLALGISIGGIGMELYYTALGVKGGPIGMLIGFGVGVSNYNKMINPIENALGWTSLVLVATSDALAGNTSLEFNQNTQQTELVVGQDTIVAFGAAYTGGDYPGEAVSDAGLNATIFGYDVLRLTGKIPTEVELKISIPNIFK